MHPYRRQYLRLDRWLPKHCNYEDEESYDSSTAAGTRDGTVTRLPLPAVWVFLPRRVILRHDKRNLRIAVPDSSVLVYARLVGESHTLLCSQIASLQLA